MKKKELKSLRMLTATPKMMKMAAKDVLKSRRDRSYSYYYDYKGYQYGLYMRCQVTGSILKIAFFLPEYMKAGGKLPAYELYIDKPNQAFITYNRLEDKWQNAKVDMISWPSYVQYSDEKWISEKDDKVLKDYLETEHGGFRGILEFQLAVRAEALKQRYRKETDPWDLDMSQVKALPKDWEHWVGKEGIDEHYIFYRYQRKGADSGYCTYCEKEVPIQNPRHNKEGICTCCHNKIVFKAEGKAGTIATKEHCMFLLQRCEDGMVIRAFKGYRKYRKGNYENPEMHWSERRRTICSEKGIPLRSYFWGDYKRIAMRWISTERFSYSWYYYGFYSYAPYVSAGRVYPKTIPSLAKSELKYTGLPEYIKKMKTVNPEDYLETWEDIPQVEQLVKAGLFALAQDCFHKTREMKAILKTSSGTLAKMLGIDGQKLKRLCEQNGDIAFLKWLQYEEKSNIILPNDVIAWLCQEEINWDALKFVKDRMSIVQIYNYIRRQMEENDKTSKNVLTTWSDYLSMAERLKMDTNDAIIYRVRKLFQRHDELVERCHQKKLELQAAEILQKYPHIEEIYQAVKDTYCYVQDNYTVIIPEKVEDILTEGQNLHHCVGESERYWERIERQESYVLFLRRSSDIDKSYYTLEIEPDGTVRQKRTMYDRQETDIEDATKFLKKWQKEISKRITDKERDLAKKSRILRFEEFAQMRKDQVIIHTGNLQGKLLVDVLMADLMENKEEAVESVMQIAA